MESCIQLHLVDLAGSERIKKTNVGGQILSEAQSINLSLLYLEQVGASTFCHCLVAHYSMRCRLSLLFMSVLEASERIYLTVTA